MTLRSCELEAVDGTAKGFYVRSRSFAFGITTHEVVVTIAWGTFDAPEAQRIGHAWAATLAGPPRDTLIDVTHLVASDRDAFTTLRDLLEPRRDERARVVRRQALVARGDFGAVFLHGYLAMFPPPYELREFALRSAALAWLGHACCTDEIAELDAVRNDLLLRLRAWLDHTELEYATTELAAAALAITERTLQRRLAEAVTGFGVELARAQVARAKRLMLETDRKLSDIALEVGCATPSVFSELFRRLTGETASEWRRRHGPGE
ncbi:MAG: helix-turn-helix domain-containing protein [Kofleriaceae bacterium]